MAVDTDAGDTFRHGSPKPLFQARVRLGLTGRQFAVTRDGQRFLVNALDLRDTGTSLTVLVNWLAAIRR